MAYFSKNAKTLDFEYLLYENHDFVGSGRSFLELFRSKMVKKTAVGKKSAQVTTKININWLRDALGGARGRKKTLEIPRRPPEEFIGHFSPQKWDDSLRAGLRPATAGAPGRGRGGVNPSILRGEKVSKLVLCVSAP